MSNLSAAYASVATPIRPVPLSKPNRKPPSYRRRDGYDQAVVTLTDAATKRRRDYWLGPYQSVESRELYHRLNAEWEACGRRLPAMPNRPTPPIHGITVTEWLVAYWQWAKTYYAPSEVSTIEAVIRIVRQMFGTTPAAAFGPKALRLVRDAMVRGDPHAQPPRKPWSRPYVNQQIHRLCAIFKWGAGQELGPITIYHQLKAVDSLKRGRTPAREPLPVRPVSDELVNSIQPYVSRQVWALIQLQRLTGARGGELLGLRPLDLIVDEKSGIWTASPIDHKTAHHGKERTIYFGPQAQAVLAPFLKNRPVHAYLFSPIEAECERRRLQGERRRTPLSCGNRPGTHRAERPQRSPGDRYTRDSYRRAIERACGDAFPPPEPLNQIRVPGKKGRRWETRSEWRRRLGPQRWAELQEWRRTHCWHPHQLRHAAGTRIRREFGLEAAQLALGHASAQITDAVYAERDHAKVVEIMRKIG